MGEVADVLGAWAVATGVRVETQAWERLETVVGLWQRYAPAFNLVGDARRPALVEHVREGLMAIGAAEQAGWVGGAWLDIGSGAGIPGLVVAAARGEVVLVEPRGRRAAFLELAIGAIKATESFVVRARLDDTTWSKIGSSDNYERINGRFEVASTRAVMAHEKWLEVAPEVLPRGVIVAHVKAAKVRSLGVTPRGRVDYGENAVIAFDRATLIAERPRTGPSRGGRI